MDGQPARAPHPRPLERVARASSSRSSPTSTSARWARSTRRGRPATPSPRRSRGQEGSSRAGQVSPAQDTESTESWEKSPASWNTSASKRATSPVAERVKNYKEFVIGLKADAGEGAGRALHGLRHAVLQQRLPGQQHHPGLQRPGVPRRLEERVRGAALDQQLPRVHRPHLPGAVRSGLHAERQRRRGGHQEHRARHHRPRLGRGLGPAAAAEGQDRQEGRRRRLRPGRHGGGAAARARRPRRHAVREERRRRRPAALRHPRLQDGEDAHRPPRRADEGRGRDVPHRRDGRPPARGQQGHQLGQGDRLARGLEGRVRRRAADRRRRAVATSPRRAMRPMCWWR